MLLSNRSFERQPPSRDAKSLFIFCEGAKTEYLYFTFFKEMDSRINIEVYKLSPVEDNSPSGLLEIARRCTEKTAANPNPKYEVIDGDEVWLIMDTDPDKLMSRKDQIQNVRSFCTKQAGWQVAESNPCFEVWLHCHFDAELPDVSNLQTCKTWKGYLSEHPKGGFDPRKHPILLQTASSNAKRMYREEAGSPCPGSTLVYTVADSIVALAKEKIERYLPR